jgi:hypothetical protein
MGAADSDERTPLVRSPKRTPAAGQARLAAWLVCVIVLTYLALMVFRIVSYKLLQPRVPFTAICFSGSLVGHRGHSLLRGVEECGASQLHNLVDRLDGQAHVFAVINACAPDTECLWNESTCAPRPRECASLSAWPLLPRVRKLQQYSHADSRPPDNGCRGRGRDWPAPYARFYSQFWGWQQCWQLVRESERQLGGEYGAIVHARPDMCVPRPFPVSLWALRSQLSHLGVLSTRRKRNPRACSDSLNIVPRRHAEAVFSTVGIYFNCTGSHEWRERFGGSRENEIAFSKRMMLGDVALGAQLERHLIRCEDSHPLFNLNDLALNGIAPITPSHRR